MEIPRSWGDLEITALPEQLGFSYGSWVCGPSWEVSSSAPGLSAPLTKGLRSSSLPTGLPQSWGDRKIVVTPVRRGSSDARAIYGRSREANCWVQGLWDSVNKGSRSPFPAMAVRQLLEGLATDLVPAQHGFTRGQVACGLSKEPSWSAQVP